MSGQEDFGPLLGVLVTCVGVVDVITLFGYILDRSRGDSQTNNNNNDITSRLKVHNKMPQDKTSLMSRSRTPIPELIVDTTAVTAAHSSDFIETLVDKVNELEVKLHELEVKSREGSMERFVEIERSRRSRTPRSGTPSPASVQSKTPSYDEDYDDEGGDDSRRNSRKPISRDDELRKPMKRRSFNSQNSHESREDELNEFTKLEKEELEDMDGFVPLSYSTEDVLSPPSYPHGISPIHEVPSATQGEEYDVVETSPEPGMASIIDKPWCDIKKEGSAIKNHDNWNKARRSISIEEEPIDKNAMEHGASKSVDPNAAFIQMEQIVERSNIESRLLMKQANVSSIDQPEEMVQEIQPLMEVKIQPVIEPEVQRVKATVYEGAVKRQQEVLVGSGSSAEKKDEAAAAAVENVV